MHAPALLEAGGAGKLCGSPGSRGRAPENSEKQRTVASELTSLGMHPGSAAACVGLGQAAHPFQASVALVITWGQ